jgi:hypothetical protein
MKTYEVVYIIGFTLGKLFVDAMSKAEAETEFWRQMAGKKITVVKVIEAKEN